MLFESTCPPIIYKPIITNYAYFSTIFQTHMFAQTLVETKSIQQSHPRLPQHTFGYILTCILPPASLCFHLDGCMFGYHPAFTCLSLPHFLCSDQKFIGCTVMVSSGFGVATVLFVSYVFCYMLCSVVNMAACPPSRKPSEFNVRLKPFFFLLPQLEQRAVGQQGIS